MKTYYILIPLYNDWKSLWKLSKAIDKKIKDISGKFSLLFINDSSSEKKPESNLNLKHINSITVINLKKNVLTGRCIATGLKYLIDNKKFDNVIIMDSDGEDKPEDILKLVNLSSTNNNQVVVAERKNRQVSLFYKIMYQIHIYFTYLSTGKLIKFGNFSILPKKIITKLVSDASLWNCFSSTIVKNSSSILYIKCNRDKRYFGKSKTNYLNLIYHSLTIISVFKINVILRFFIYSILFTLLLYKKFMILNLIIIFAFLFFTILIYIISNRGNLKELLNSKSNIDSVEEIK